MSDAYRTQCDCGWSGRSRRTPAEALAEGRAHARATGHADPGARIELGPRGPRACPACASTFCYWVMSPDAEQCLCVDCGGELAHAKLSRLAMRLGPTSPHFDALLALCERAERRA